MFPANSGNEPVDRICITMPIGPDATLTVSPWITETATVNNRPETGPKRNVPMKMGMSAGSYSIQGALGKSGKWTIEIRTIESAASIAIVVSFLVDVFMLVPSIE